MSFHRNAKLGLAGRFALVGAIENGLSLNAAAAAFNVSPATAHRWWHRWLEAVEEARRTLSCLFDRSSRPHSSPRQLAPQLEAAICACRRETGWGPRLVAGATGFAHLTVWKVLKRAGISRPLRAAKEPANRYEWPCPGDLLHMDTSRYARFLRPGHRVTGGRSQRARDWMRPETNPATTTSTRSSTTTHASGLSSATTTRPRPPSQRSSNAGSPTLPATASAPSE
jgi:transposase